MRQGNILASFSERRSIVSAAALLFAIFAVPTAVGILLRPVQFLAAGGFFLWPYPLLLALQSYLPPASASSWVGGLVFGFLIVLATATAAERLLGPRRWVGPRRWAIAAAVTFLPLLVVTLTVWSLAQAAGLPVGE